LAAISFVGHADDSAFYSVNVVGTTNLLSALAELKTPLKKVLIASSANIYGNCEISPISEHQYAAPMNHYATSKLAMEFMACTYMERLPIVITRPFNYTGPGQAPQFLIPKLVSHFSSRADSIELGNLHVEREFNDVRMVCDAYLNLLNYGEPGQVYNVCSGNPFTLSHVLDTLAAITSHHLKVNVNPAFVRANEVHRLCGDPAKLNHLMMKHQSSAPNYALSDTLKWMLAEATN
jgi:nucleoside-diphosphate-sugar epimerase